MTTAHKLTHPQIGAIETRIDSVLSGAEASGSVTLVIKRGRIAAIRWEVSQQMPDEPLGPAWSRPRRGQADETEIVGRITNFIDRSTKDGGVGGES